jgi:hypothetical protein
MALTAYRLLGQSRTTADELRTGVTVNVNQLTIKVGALYRSRRCCTEWLQLPTPCTVQQYKEGWNSLEIQTHDGKLVLLRILATVEERSFGEAFPLSASGENDGVV